jgi:mRNA interferase HigB
MKLLGMEILDSFIRKHADARGWIENWIADVRGGEWRGTQDIKDRYKSASFLGDNIVIFNVKGNDYRLEVQVAYQIGIVLVKWAGTHSEYDKRHK